MKFAIGQKKGMTQIFHDSGKVIPVTAVKIEKNVVLGFRKKEKDGYSAVILGSGVLKKNIKKPVKGFLKDLKNSRWIKEFKIDSKYEENVSEKFQRGTEYGVEIFRPGDKITVTGYVKGRGFQGVVKRHNFAGAPASHGTKDQLRMPGSIGATGPAHVFKGVKMAGHMGTNQKTIKGLKIVKVDFENEVVYISGSLPGAYNSIIILQGPGRAVLNKKVKEVENKADDNNVEEKDVEKMPENAESKEVEKDAVDSDDVNKDSEEVKNEKVDEETDNKQDDSEDKASEGNGNPEDEKKDDNKNKE